MSDGAPSLVVLGEDGAELLAALHAECFPPGERWDADAMRALLRMPGCFALVAATGEPGGLALGRVAVDEAELLTIGVRPVCRRTGIGRRLLDAVCRHAAERGAATLFLEVSRANSHALALYETAGFVSVGVRRRYYPDGSDACVLSRRLDRPELSSS